MLTNTDVEKAAIYFFAHRIEKGGGVIQAERTYQALKAYGVPVSFILREGTVSVDDLDRTARVHHFVGANPAFIPLMRQVKESGMGAVALSTIYWWTPAVQRVITPRLVPFLRYTAARYAKRVLKRFVPRHEVFRLPDLLLPNSPGEATLVKKYFPVSPEALICPLPNAADPLPPWRVNDLSVELPAEFVLCPGSFNSRKNQLSLVRAMKPTNLPVVFMGAPGWTGDAGSFAEYHGQCQAEATDRMMFLGHIEHRSSLWHEVFRRARVLAMPSACETPSLAALEAALYGSSIAITAIGSTYEYFGPNATYCDPGNVDSIRSAVEIAWQKGKSEALADHVASRFLWSNTARLTALTYRAVLKEETALKEYQRLTQDLWYNHRDSLMQ